MIVLRNIYPTAQHRLCANLAVMTEPAWVAARLNRRHDRAVLAAAQHSRHVYLRQIEIG
jgi:hypothetical protein